MLFTFVTVSAALIYFALMFTGGKSWREVREMFYGNYFAEDAVINDTDKPNSRQAVENCIENNIGIFQIPIEKLESFRALLIEFYESGSDEKIISFMTEHCIKRLR